ncbi:MAG TPA: NAD-binding protein, partial [Candidatus Ozemobacteraceae bacterium]|nr:NAD-binding protein [Candidatus Ozemobacteraceae bacterium]
ATVGYGEVHPLSPAGRLFTILLLITGAGLMAYTVTALGQFVVEGKLREIWGKRRMKDRINGLKHHFIVCGAGNTGLAVVHNLLGKQTPIVVIDSNPKVVEELIEEQIPAIEGDATADETLIEGGLKRAAGLVTALPHDADNVFVTLTAKGINPDVFVVSTAGQLESAPKLKRAGANYVVTPAIIAGARMAAVLMRPSVVDFVDATMAGDDQGLQMEEFRIKDGSFLAQKALKDSDIRKRSGAIIVSVRRGEKTIINPEPGYVFDAGDILVALGTSEQVMRIGELATIPEKV